MFHDSLRLRLKALVQDHGTFIRHSNYVSIVDYVAILVGHLGQLPDPLQHLRVALVVWTQWLLYPSARLCTFNIYDSQNPILTRVVTLQGRVGTLDLHLFKVYLRHVIRRELVCGVKWINVPPVQVLGLEVVIVDVSDIHVLIGPYRAYFRPPFFKFSIARLRSRNILNIHLVLALHKTRGPSKSIRLRSGYVISPQSAGRGRVSLLIRAVGSLIIRALLDAPVVPSAKRLILPGTLHAVFASEATSLILRTYIHGLLDLHGVYGLLIHC